MLSKNSFGNVIVIPADKDPNTMQMMGGTYAATSDSRWSEAVGIYGAVPIHDRRETVEQYNSYSN
jgi:hypothetical protein